MDPFRKNNCQTKLWQGWSICKYQSPGWDREKRREKSADEKFTLVKIRGKKHYRTRLMPWQKLCLSKQRQQTNEGEEGRRERGSA